MLYLIIAVLMVVAVVTAVPMLKPTSRFKELERFWVARRLTTSWAAGED